MSGLVMTRLLRLRIAGALGARRVAVVDRRADLLVQAEPCSERAWSWASALVGYRYSARAVGSALSTSSVGS